MRVLAGLVLTALAASAAAASTGAGPKTIGTRGSVFAISADGARVAIASELRGKKTCQYAAAWTPSTGGVVRFGGTDCTAPDDNAEHHVDLTLAGTRVAWVDYDYGNHAYCDGPYTATLAKPKPVALPSDCDGTSADEYYTFYGDGDFLVMSSSVYCEVEGECGEDENGEPLPAGDYDVTLQRVVGTAVRPIAKALNGRAVLDANAGRALVWEPPGNVLVYSAAGKVLASFPAGKDPLYVGRLDGDNVVFPRGRTLTVGSISSGETKTLTLAAAGKLRDCDGGVAVYTAGGAIHLLTLASGRDRVYAKTVKLVDAQLEPSGLFYAANSGKGPKPGRVTFVPRSRLGL
jgi:hypothetical protein